MRIPLSPLERAILMVARHQGLNFTIVAHVAGPLTEPRLRGALAELQRRHPLLAARVEAGERAAHYVDDGVPPIPLRVAERRGAMGWVDEIERELCDPIDHGRGPLLRCVWLRGDGTHDLILVCDHMSADGSAGAYALRDLLQALGDPGRPLDLLPPPPQLAELIPPEATAAVLASPPDGSFMGIPTSPGDPGDPDEPMRVLAWSLEPAAVAALTERCHAEHTTIQGALAAAFLMHFAAQPGADPVRRVEIPLNLRAHLTQPVGEAYGLYISLLTVAADAGPGRSLWDVARDVRHAFEQLAAGPAPFAMPILAQAMMRGLTAEELAQQFASLASVRLGYDLSLSNLGRLDFPTTYGDLRLLGMHGPTIRTDIPGHRVVGVSTVGGRMGLTFVSHDRLAPAIVEDAMHRLATAVPFPPEP